MCIQKQVTNHAGPHLRPFACANHGSIQSFFIEYFSYDKQGLRKIMGMVHINQPQQHDVLHAGAGPTALDGTGYSGGKTMQDRLGLRQLLDLDQVGTFSQQTSRGVIRGTAYCLFTLPNSSCQKHQTPFMGVAHELSITACSKWLTLLLNYRKHGHCVSRLLALYVP